MRYETIAASARMLDPSRFERLSTSRRAFPNTDKRTGVDEMTRHIYRLPIFAVSVLAFALGTNQKSPAGIYYAVQLLNGQPAIVARTKEGSPYYVLFLYGKGELVNLIHVIAGRKLAALHR